MKHQVFGYGMITNLAAMHQRCPLSECLGPAWIQGYRFCWRTWGDIEFSTDDHVLGLLWVMDDDDLARLDAYEGYPHKYFRQRVQIHTALSTVTGWAYMMTEQGPESLPGEHYRDALFEGYAENHISTEQMLLGLKRLNG